jgi:hypothetical protein
MGANQHGGARTGAGRKPKAVEDDLQELLQTCWTKEQRELAFRTIASRAAAGSLDAFKLLAAYAWGTPTQRQLEEPPPPDEFDLDRILEAIFADDTKVARLAEVIERVRARRDDPSSG